MGGVAPAVGVEDRAATERRLGPASTAVSEPPRASKPPSTLRRGVSCMARKGAFASARVAFIVSPVDIHYSIEQRVGVGYGGLAHEWPPYLAVKQFAAVSVDGSES